MIRSPSNFSMPMPGAGSSPVPPFGLMGALTYPNYLIPQYPGTPQFIQGQGWNPSTGNYTTNPYLNALTDVVDNQGLWTATTYQNMWGQPSLDISGYMITGGGGGWVG